MTTTQAFEAVKDSPSLRAWESGVVWLVLGIGLVGLVGVPYAAGTSWAYVLELVRVGALSPFSFVSPLLFLAACVLLVMKRKVATFLFAVHIPLAVGGLALRYGINTISPFWWFGYICEALIVCFCLRLWARGALR